MSRLSPVGLALLFTVAACRSRAPDRPPAPPDAARVSAVAPVVDAAPAPPPPRGKLIALLFSGDLRGEYEAHPNGGLARRAAATARVRQEADGVIQVDAGNLLLRPAPPPAEGLVEPDAGEVDRRAKLLLSGLARLQLAAFTPGPLDFQISPARLRALVKQAKLPTLAANLVDDRGKPFFEATRLVTVADVPVGLFGLAAPPPATPGVSATDTTAAARAAVAELRERGARLVVGLFGLGGRAEAHALAQAVEGIDVLVLASEDAKAGQTESVGRTFMVAPRKQGRFLGRLDLHFIGDEVPRTDRRAGPVTGSWLELDQVKLDRSFRGDPAFLKVVDAYIEEGKRRAAKGQPVGIAWRAPWTLPPPKGGKPMEEPLESWTYGSNGACALCHQDAAAQWKTTAHAFALQTLELKGRDKDPECLTCHATSFGRPGGTKSVKTATTYFADVGCESCHGPSVDHVRAQNKTGTVRDAPPKVCAECHTPEQSDDPFDYARALADTLGPGHGRPLAQ